MLTDSLYIESYGVLSSHCDIFLYLWCPHSSWKCLVGKPLKLFFLSIRCSGLEVQALPVDRIEVLLSNVDGNYLSCKKWGI